MIQRTYGVGRWTDHDDLLGKIAIKRGKLLKGGDPDINTCAKQLLNDWQRGKIPYFTIPDEYAEKQAEDMKAGKLPAVDEEMAEIGRQTSQELGKIHVVADYTIEDKKGEGQSKVEVDMKLLNAMEDGSAKEYVEEAEDDDISGDVRDEDEAEGMDGAGDDDEQDGEQGDGEPKARAPLTKKVKVLKKKKGVVKKTKAAAPAAAAPAPETSGPKKGKKGTTSSFKAKTGSSFYADSDVKGKRKKKGGGAPVAPRKDNLH